MVLMQVARLALRLKLLKQVLLLPLAVTDIESIPRVLLMIKHLNLARQLIVVWALDVVIGVLVARTPCHPISVGLHHFLA